MENITKRWRVNKANYKMFKNGKLNTFCPMGYNFLVGAVVGAGNDTPLLKNRKKSVIDTISLKGLSTVNIY